MHAFQETEESPLQEYIEVEADSSKELNLESVEQVDVIYPDFKAPIYDSTKEIYTIEGVPSPRGNGIIGYVSDPNDFT